MAVSEGETSLISPPEMAENNVIEVTGLVDITGIVVLSFVQPESKKIERIRIEILVLIFIMVRFSKFKINTQIITFIK